MRTFVVHSFYLCGVLFLIYELLKLGGVNLTTLSKELEAKSNAEKERNEELAISDPSAKPVMLNQVTFVLFALVYFGWVILYAGWSLIGLFTSQWVFFLLLLALSLIHTALQCIFTNYAKILFRIDAFITVVLLVFMLLNRFHLNIL